MLNILKCLGLLLAAAVILAACGAQPANAPAPTAADGAASAATAAPAATAMGDMAGSDHGSTDHGSMADAEAPYDAQFIDSMIVHHEGAVAMANQVLQEAERTELKTLANAIITAQTAEIAQLREWRSTWYPDVPETQGMGMDMGDMEIGDDASRPFDQRFIEAMIAHHEGAIAMAKDAQQQAERQEIKTLAQNIITAQEGEIAQMKQWQQEWFGQ